MAAKVVLVQRIQAYSHLSQMAVDRVSVNESQSQYLPTYLSTYLPSYLPVCHHQPPSPPRQQVTLVLTPKINPSYLGLVSYRV
jgi:hypothetical protein